MAETYTQAAKRLFARIEERKKLVQFPQTIAGRILLRHAMGRGEEIAGRNFDGEAQLLMRFGEKIEGKLDEYA